MNNLRRIRRLKEITQYELSIKTQIPQSVLSLVERFYKKPSLKMKRKVSKALGSKIEEIFPDENKKC